MRRRREFPNAVKREAFARSNGICECHRLAGIVDGFSPAGCGQQLRLGDLFYEHVEPDALSGANDLANCACLTKTCWKRKTARHDLPRIAKDKRLRDMGRAIRTGTCASSRPIDGCRRSPWRKHVNGLAERRLG